MAQPTTGTLTRRRHARSNGHAAPAPIAPIIVASATAAPAAALPWCSFDVNTGAVVVNPRRKKVAIVGFASSTRDKAPYADPDFEIWGLNQLNRFIPRLMEPALADRAKYPVRWFEMHNRPMFEADVVRDTDYVGWLQKADIPIYMNEHYADMPTSVRYPIEKVIDFFSKDKTRPRDYFTSSPAYEVAIAIIEGFEEIQIFGIDLIVGEEYFYQKACMEYWLGQCEGRGITLILPDESALLKQTHRYGYVTAPTFGPFSLAHFEARIGSLDAERNKLLTNINAIEGAMCETRQWRDAMELYMRGGKPLADVTVAVPGGSK